MRKRGRTDANQAPIVKTLRKVPGVSVRVTSALGDGFPDIVVGFQRRNFMFEIKKDGDATLTDDESKFAMTWCGQYTVILSAADALAVMGIK